MFCQRFYDTGHSGPFLSDRHINAEHVLALLVDDRINSYGGFAGLPVTDDQFALTTSNRDHAINSLDTGLHRFVH